MVGSLPRYTTYGLYIFNGVRLLVSFNYNYIIVDLDNGKAFRHLGTHCGGPILSGTVQKSTADTLNSLKLASINW